VGHTEPAGFWNVYDRPHADLREAIQRFEDAGELLRIRGAHWKLEMGTLAEIIYRGKTPPAILFEDIPGYAKGFRTLYGHFSSIKRVALTLGLPLQHDRKVDIVQRYHQRMQNMKTLPPRFVKDGPVLQNVLEGDAIEGGHAVEGRLAQELCRGAGTSCREQACQRCRGGAHA